MSESLIQSIEYTPEEIDLIRRTVAAGANNDEFDLFMHNVRRYGLDCLAREIYFVKRQGKGTIQTGIDGLLKIAHRTGACAGIDDAEFADKNDRGFPSAAKVVVYKMVQGVRCPFGATARWDEYYPGDSQGFQWKRMPHVMLGKCALALALRKAFPADMGGLYVAEEMDQAGSAERGAQEPQRPKANPAPDAPPTTASADGAVESASNPAAFGYVPAKWPGEAAFTKPRSDAQKGKAHASWKERGLPEDAYGATRTEVVKAFGFDTHDGMGQTMLWIDFILSADDDQVRAAMDAAYAANGQEKLL